MDEFITTAGAVALVKAIVDFLKYIRANDVNGYVTQAAVWLAGIGVTLLLKISDFADAFDVSGVTLDTANAGTVILAGLGLGSATMLANDFKKAIDSADTAVKPPLVP